MPEGFPTKRTCLCYFLNGLFGTRSDNGSVHGMMPVILSVLCVAFTEIQAPNPAQISGRPTRNGSHVASPPILGEKKTIFEIVLNSYRHITIVV